MGFSRVLIAVKVYVQFCVLLMDNMAVVCVTVKRAGKVPNVIYH